MPDGLDALVDAALRDRLALPAVPAADRIATLRWCSEAGARGIAFHPVRVGEYAPERAKLDRLRQQVEDGHLTLRGARILPGAQAAEAHSLLDAGGARGRLILQF